MSYLIAFQTGVYGFMVALGFVACVIAVLAVFGVIGGIAKMISRRNGGDDA